MPFCVRCGRPAAVGDRFCPSCGQALIDAAPPPESTFAVRTSAPCVLREGLFRSTPFRLVVTGGHLVLLRLTSEEKKRASRHPEAGYAGGDPLAEVAARKGSFALASADLAKVDFLPSAWLPSAEDVPPSRRPAYLGLWTGIGRFEIYFDPDADEVALASALAPFRR
jgi:hypothetical protein